MNHRHFTYLLILSMFLWGGGWTALKILTVEVSVDVMVFWRFFIVSLSFLPILYLLKKPLKINLANLKYVAGSSILNIAFMVSAFYGIKYGFAGSGSVIITTLSPVMTFLLVALIFKKRLQNIQYFGLILGIIGGIVMLQLNDFSLFFNSANLFFLLSATIWAGITMLSQHSQVHIHPIHYSFLISIIASIVSFFYAYNSDLLAVLEMGSKFWISLLYLAVLGQSVATTIFYMASGKLGSEKTSSFMFLVPVFALFIAWLVLDEPIELHIVVGGFISVLALFFINKKSPTQTKKV
ncbi:MAG: DMT family transporter [Sulfurimonas sp.]|nr:DMT family transporter [Sulfurimonas sp.]MBU1216518.1 DMT family transporter [bacterium]MBU1433527.1 DMT family transporter [bacterium]MBU1503291.1 DMT family transporter [bacterium]MBU3938380.1 DMT family transporter [bacterium]